MAQSKPWEKYARPQGGGVYYDPYRAQEEARKQRLTDIEAGGLDVRRQSNERNAATMAIKNRQTLRQEYASLPDVRNYRIAVKQAQIALSTDATPQGDTSLTYAYAKAMDPASVVRESENQMATNTQPWLQAAAENIKKQFGVKGAGNFTPAARAALRQEILRVVASDKIQYDARRGEYHDYAKTYGIDPYEVIGKDDTAVYAPAFRAYGEKNGDPDKVISGIIGGDPIQPAQPPAGDIGAQPRQPAPFGSTQAAQPIPPEMQQEQQAYLAQNWGNIDPQDYVSFRINQDHKYGFGSDPDAYRQDVARFNEYAQKGIQPSQVPAIPDVPRQLTDIERLRNDAVSNPVGAGVATALNAGGFGIPQLLEPDQFAAIRQAHPVSTVLGDIGGGVIGAGLASRGLRAASTVVANPSIASLLANPLTADLGYGAVYGGATAKSEGRDPVIGALTGAAGGYLGNRLGGAIGRAFPKITGVGGDIRALDESVPTSQQLKDLAQQKYASAEASGLTATPDETFALADTTNKILSDAGRITPKGSLADSNANTNGVYKLINDFAGEPMSPSQIQTVRSTISDGFDSQKPSDKRIARLLLNNFDQWSDETNPDLAAGLKDARATASRYLQGDKIAKARDLADVRAGQFSNSGQGNALRTDFRQLDRNIVKGNEQFAPGVEAAVADVARGTPVSNALRFVGRFAPTGPVSAIPTIAAMSGGASAVGPLGAVPGALLGATAYGARQLGQGLTERAAQVAENSAYGGQAYTDALDALLAQAQAQGGHAGAGGLAQFTPIVTDAVTQALMSPQASGY